MNCASTLTHLVVYLTLPTQQTLKWNNTRRETETMMTHSRVCHSMHSRDSFFGGTGTVTGWMGGGATKPPWQMVRSLSVVLEDALHEFGAPLSSS